MSASVLDSKGFNAIIASDPSKINYTAELQRDRNLSGISLLSQAVISYLQDSNNVSVKDIDVFIEKVGLIDRQFETAQLGTPFATDLVALKLLFGLREGLGTDSATLIADPFILELKELSGVDKVESKVLAARKLYLFMGQVLTPALQKASSRAEVKILEQFVDQCIALNSKVRVVDTKGALAERFNAMINTYNARHLKTSGLFRFVLEYKDGQLQRFDETTRNDVVNGLTGFVADFEEACKQNLVSNEEKVGVYKGLVAIEGALGKQTHVSPLVERLNAVLGIPQGMRSSFPIELAEIKGGSKMKLFKDLRAFQRDFLIPYLREASSYSQLDHVSGLLSNCNELSKALGSVDVNGALKAQGKTIQDTVDVKRVILNPVFLKILAANPEKIGDLRSEAYRGKLVKILTAVANGVKRVENRPLFTRKLKQQFMLGMKAMQREFISARHGKDFEPVMTLLDVSSKALVGSSKMGNPNVVKGETLDQRKVRAFKKIQGLIAKLDPQSLSFKADVADILQEIGFVKRKYPNQTTRDFIFLERAMLILQRPNQHLAVTSEEGLVMRSIGAKHGVSKSVVEEYKLKTEARSIRRAQIELIKGLKKKTRTLEELNSLAKSASSEIHERTMQKRFEIFVATYPLKPALSQHFSMHFPRIVRMLKNYSETVALKEVVVLWNQIKELYDNSSDGGFSKLLATYSYMNPETVFPDILKEAQEALLDGIDFKKIGLVKEMDFRSYMKKSVSAVSKALMEIFEKTYKHYFAYRHRWLAMNLPYIKVPYNQADEKDTNLGRGVCMSNSLNRIGILAADPKAPIEALPMGSTEKTRISQTKVSHYYLAAQNRKISYSTAAFKELEQAAAFGIKLTKVTAITNPSSHIHQNLVNQMFMHAKTGKTSFLVSLERSKGGHAVNVHIDPEKKIYRLMDDNIGLLEYSDEVTFKREVSRYMSVFYRKHNAFYFYDFEKC